MVDGNFIDYLVLRSLEKCKAAPLDDIRKFVSIRAELNCVDRNNYPGTKVPRWELVFQQRVDTLKANGSIENLWRDMFALTDQGRTEVQKHQDSRKSMSGESYEKR